MNQAAADELTTLALQFHQQGRLDEASAHYVQALSLNPKHVMALTNLGSISFNRREYQSALELNRAALAIDPAFESALYNKARTHHELGDWDQAIGDYKACLKHNPQHTASLENLIALLLARGSYDACLAYARQRVRAARDFKSLRLLGHARLETGDMQGATDAYRQALDLSPARPEIVYDIALQDLKAGRFEPGWRQFRQRFSVAEFLETNSTKAIPLPVWSGEDPVDKRLFITAEQGIGDEVMFSSCLTDLQKVASRLVVECDARLLKIFQRSFPAITFVPKFDENPPSIDWLQFDYTCSIADLPRFLRPAIDSFTTAPWLKVCPVRAQHWSSKLTVDHRIKVGIAWSGGAQPRDRVKRSIDLRPLLRAFDSTDMALFSLQYDPDHGAIQTANAAVKNPLTVLDGLDCRDDLDGLFAVIASLDLVVTTDNATAHFAGALGTPVWLLLPQACDWRWMNHGDTAHWYGSMRLFRNQNNRNWKAVIKALTAALRDYKASDSPQTTIECAIQQPNVGQATSTEAPHSVDSPPMLTGEKVLLLNDTLNWYHWGCSCTSLGIYRQLLSQGNQVRSLAIASLLEIDVFPQSVAQFDDQSLLDRFKCQYPSVIELMQECDRVVVNGEGTLHNTGKPALVLLYLAYIARQDLGRRVEIINHSCFPDDLAVPQDHDKVAVYQKVYRTLDYVAVRDHYSAEICEAMGVPATLAFDCLPLAIRDVFSHVKSIAPEDLITIGASALADEGYLKFVRRLLTDNTLVDHCRLELLVGSRAHLAGEDTIFAEQLAPLLTSACKVVFCDSEAQWLSQIRRSKLLISGRFHHSVAAACLQTPFLMFASNTPKNQALMERLGDYPGSVLNRTRNPYSILKDALQHPQKYQVSHTLIDDLAIAAEANFSPPAM